jgi:hypothetical protein
MRPGHDACAEGIRQFIDEKAYKPVFSPYQGAAAGKAPATLPSRKRAAAARGAGKGGEALTERKNRAAVCAARAPLRARLEDAAIFGGAVRNLLLL